MIRGTTIHDTMNCSSRLHLRPMRTNASPSCARPSRYCSMTSPSYVSKHLIKPYEGNYRPNVLDHNYTKDLYILAH